MDRQIIAVDIDNTVVNTGILWFRYLDQRFDRKDKWFTMCSEGKFPYNLADMFELPEGVDGFDFWRDPNLYNGLNPLKDSVEVLSKLSETYDIIFVSQAKGWHHKSKFKFIEKWFPFNKGLILTKEKNYVRCDYFIDDSLTQINNMPIEVDCFWFQTEYVQSGVTINNPHCVTVVNDWKTIEELFK